MILLYHNIIPNDSPADRLCAGQAITQGAFEHQIRWLENHFRIVSLAEYIDCFQKTGFYKHQYVALSFDDGFRVTFQCVFSFLAENNMPATIFVSTGHLEHGELLWFSYLKALCFEKVYKTLTVNGYPFQIETVEQRIQAWNEMRVLAKTSGDPVFFCKMLAQTYPLAPEITAEYEGMTYDQLKAAGDCSLLEVGAHTINHPFLNLMSRETQQQEVIESKRILSEITGKPVRYFAYPGGEYNHDTVEFVKAAGYEAAFAVIPNHSVVDQHFEISRIGIYSPSLFKLQLKAFGVADLARRLGFRVG